MKARLKAMERRLVCAASLLWCGVATILVAAQPASAVKDISGAKDPSGIKRYDGSIVIGYKFEKFGEFTFLLGPLTSTGSGRLPSKAHRTEGQRTRVLRAASVVRELTVKHAVSAARLKPAGTGPLAPVAPNDSEDGRAKNRRVELVKQ
jgi:hypothetical protein